MLCLSLYVKIKAYFLKSQKAFWKNVSRDLDLFITRNQTVLGAAIKKLIFLWKQTFFGAPLTLFTICPQKLLGDCTNYHSLKLVLSCLETFLHSQEWDSSPVFLCLALRDCDWSVFLFFFPPKYLTFAEEELHNLIGCFIAYYALCSVQYKST